MSERLIVVLSDVPPRDPSACQYCGAMHHRSEDCIMYGPPEQQRKYSEKFRADPLVREIVRRMSALRREQRRNRDVR